MPILRCLINCTIQRALICWRNAEKSLLLLKETILKNKKKYCKKKYYFHFEFGDFSPHVVRFFPVYSQ